MDIFRTILSLRPDAKFAVTGDTYEGLEWFDDNDLPPPTKEEVLAEQKRLENEWQNKQYQRDREVEYPSVQEQLDILYHQGYEGWKLAIDEVKNKYPKP